jgi:hypothetical protein
VADRQAAWENYCLFRMERLDSAMTPLTSGMYGHSLRAFQRQLRTIGDAALGSHDESCSNWFSKKQNAGVASIYPNRYRVVIIKLPNSILLESSKLNKHYANGPFEYFEQTLGDVFIFRAVSLYQSQTKRYAIYVEVSLAPSAHRKDAQFVMKFNYKIASVAEAKFTFVTQFLVTFLHSSIGNEIRSFWRHDDFDLLIFVVY